MKWLDFHNLYLAMILGVLALLIRAQLPSGWFAAGVTGAVVFACLSGRVITHGTDMRKAGKDHWARYVVVNAVFNCIVALSIGAIILAIDWL